MNGSRSDGAGQELERGCRRERALAVDLLQGLCDYRVAGVDRGGGLIITPSLRPVAERGGGKARSEPGIPSAGVPRDHLLEALSGDAVTLTAERDHAGQAPRV